MLLRRLMLALGLLALIAGIGLAVVSLRVPRGGPAGPAAGVPPQAILVATHDIAAASLLRSDDLKYAEVAANAVPPGAFVRGKAAETDVLGAATRRAIKAGDPIPTDAIIRPTELGFLPAVLHPGMRAIAIHVDEAEVGAGLIQPGDFVDVLLTQNLAHEGGGSDVYRSVGETVMHNVRVIAADQTVNTTPEGQKQTVKAPPRVPHTVTLEVTPEQAQALVVAHQLGQLQLVLRSLTASASPGAEPPPTWATQVSAALRELVGGPTPGGGGGGGGGIKAGAATAQANGPSGASSVEIVILRGSRTTTQGTQDQRCYSERTGTTVRCTGTINNGPGAGAGESGGEGTAAAPGRSGALAPAPDAAHPA